jgi:biopolymer transport protein ExbD
MPLKSAALDEPQMNLTPMLDVVFNLIIFFVVSMQFSNEEEIEVQVPYAGHAQPLSALPDEIVVNVAADGRIIAQNRQVTPSELKAILTEARNHYADQAVLVRGDGRGALQHVVDVFSICNEVGIVNYKLATSRVEPAAP